MGLSWTIKTVSTRLYLFSSTLDLFSPRNKVGKISSFIFTDRMESELQLTVYAAQTHLVDPSFLQLLKKNNLDTAKNSVWQHWEQKEPCSYGMYLRNHLLLFPRKELSHPQRKWGKQMTPYRMLSSAQSISQHRPASSSQYVVCLLYEIFSTYS